MTTIKLQLNRKFLVIDSPIDFELYCPEQQDGVKRRKGSWQLTIHDLLTKSHYPLNPVYNLELIYDESKLEPFEKVVFYTTDLDLGQSLRGVDGQLVTWDYNEKLNVTSLYDSFNGNGVKEYIIYSDSYFDLFLDYYKSKYGNNLRHVVTFYVNKSNCLFTLGEYANDALLYIYNDKVYYFDGGQYDTQAEIGEILSLRIDTTILDSGAIEYKLIIFYVVDGIRKVINFSLSKKLKQLLGYMTGYLI